MLNYKGKGLTEKQYENFLENEKSFGNDFISYMKSLTNPREIEFAKIKRKYQSSFVDEGNFSAKLAHKFSNPDEFNENLSRSVKSSGLLELSIFIPEDFEVCGCDIIILSDINEELRDSFQNELKNLSIRFKSLFQALKYIDTHILSISVNVCTSVKEAKEVHRKAQLEKILQLSRAAKAKIIVTEEAPKIKEKIIENAKIEKREIEENKIIEIEENKNIDEEDDEKFVDNQKHEEHKRYTNVMVSTSTLKISAKQLTFRNLGSASLTSLTIEILCSRCSNRRISILTLSETALENCDYLFTDSFECECTYPISFEITPKIIFQKSGKDIATGKFQGCSPLDIVEMNYKFTCPDCGEFTEISNTRCYIPYIVTCIHCYSKGTFQIDGFDYSDIKNKTDEKDDKSSFIGKPLPKNGVCKHFKNSFR